MPIPSVTFIIGISRNLPMLLTNFQDIPAISNRPSDRRSKYCFIRHGAVDSVVHSFMYMLVTLVYKALKSSISSIIKQVFIKHNQAILKCFSFATSKHNVLVVVNRHIVSKILLH